MLLRIPILLVTVAVLGQVPSQQRPVFRSDAHFVTVDAYPLKDGKVVEGLTAADFEVLEDGQPQTIDTFEFVGGNSAEPETSRRDPNTLSEMRDLVADPRARAFVVYLDIKHVSVDGAHSSRVPLVEMLNRIITPNDLFAVLSSDHEATSLAFGRKVVTTEDMLRRYWPWGLRDSMMRSDVEDGLRACFLVKCTAGGCVTRYFNDGARRRELPEPLIERHREDLLLTKLEDLVINLGGLREGRSSVILFSEGWRLLGPDAALAKEVEDTDTGWVAPPIGVRGGQLTMFNTLAEGERNTCVIEGVRLAREDYSRRLRELMALANRMNVTFFPVNPRGLVVFDSPISERVMPVSPAANVLVDDFDRVKVRADGLWTLAENTDGIAVLNNNDMSAGLRKVSDQLSSFYLLGYYSTNTKFDGKTRRITVRAKPVGVEVKARRGYVAPTEAERAARSAPKPAAKGPTETDLAIDALARLRSSSDRGSGPPRAVSSGAEGLIGPPQVFRAAPGSRAPLVPATDPMFRRTERIHVEWPILGALDGRVARLLGRNGQPLSVAVTVTERESADGRRLALDANLAPLTAGDYILELVVTSAGATKRTLLAFRLVP